MPPPAFTERKPLPRRSASTYHYFAHKSEFIIALWCASYHGNARMMVMQEVSTQRFVLITYREFEENWVESSR